MRRETPSTYFSARCQRHLLMSHSISTLLSRTSIIARIKITFPAHATNDSHRIVRYKFSVPNGLITYLNESCFSCSLEFTAFSHSFRWVFRCRSEIRCFLRRLRSVEKQKMHERAQRPKCISFCSLSFHRQAASHPFNGVKTSKTYRLGNNVRGFGCWANNAMDFPLLSSTHATTRLLRRKCFLMVFVFQRLKGIPLLPLQRDCMANANIALHRDSPTTICGGCFSHRRTKWISNYKYNEHERTRKKRRVNS